MMIFENGYDPLGSWIDPIRNNQILEIRRDAIKIEKLAPSTIYCCFPSLEIFRDILWGLQATERRWVAHLCGTLKAYLYRTFFLSVSICFFFFFFFFRPLLFGRDGLLSVLDIWNGLCVNWEIFLFFFSPTPSNNPIEFRLFMRRVRINAKSATTSTVNGQDIN